jgi:hypothetical protein
MLNLAKEYSGSVCVDLVVSVSCSVLESAGVFGASLGAGGASFFFLQWCSTSPSFLAGFVKADCSLKMAQLLAPICSKKVLTKGALYGSI